MNFINRLQQENRSLREQIDLAAREILDFKVFLESAKFLGVSPEGERMDWINIADVRSRLESINSLLPQVSDFNLVSSKAA